MVELARQYFQSDGNDSHGEKLELSVESITDVKESSTILEDCLVPHPEITMTEADVADHSKSNNTDVKESNSNEENSESNVEN